MLGVYPFTLKLSKLFSWIANPGVYGECTATCYITQQYNTANSHYCVAHVQGHEKSLETWGAKNLLEK